MTLAEADSELAEWRDRQALIDQNLDSFAQLPVFQRICALLGRQPPVFDGRTQLQLSAALEVFGDLRQQQAILAATIQRAAERRASLSRLMPSRQTLDEIQQILTGPSIQLESSPTPPARRELLRDVAQAVQVSPGRFLEIMLDSFRFVRDTFVGLETTEQQNSRMLDAQRAELTRVAGLVPSQSTDSSPAWTAANDLLSQLTAFARHDPLEAAERLPDLVARVKDITETLAATAKIRLDFEGKLRDSASTIAQIREFHDRAKRAIAERELKVDAPRGASVPMPSFDNEIETLAAWLAKLERTAQNGELAPAAVGLKKWSESAAAMLANDRSACEEDESALRVRRDLRGLFDALQAKACSMGRAENPQLTAIGNEITTMLARRPTPMRQVQELVARYEKGLL